MAGGTSNGEPVNSQGRDFGRFVVRAGLFLLVNLVLIGIALWITNALGERTREGFSESWTGSVVLDTPVDDHVDVLILGPSHARAMAWGGNHEIVEAEFGADVLNLGTAGAGPYVVDILLDYFYSRGNTAGTVVLFADPFPLFSVQFNENRPFMTDEPFDPEFLRVMLDNGVSNSKLLSYAQSKAWPAWWLIPQDFGKRTATVDEIDPREHEAGLRRMYPEGVSSETFETYAAIFADIVDMAIEHGSQVVLVLPPTLYSEYPGDDLALGFYADLAESESVTFVDLRDAATDPSQFIDLSHMNGDGVAALSSRLRPYVVSGDAAAQPEEPSS